jgi:hypothetical protein
VDEIELLDQILRVLLRGGDTRVLVRHSAFKGLVRKASVMQRRATFVVAQRAAKLSGNSTTDEGIEPLLLVEDP